MSIVVTLSAAIVGYDELGSSPLHHLELVNELFGPKQWIRTLGLGARRSRRLVL